MRNRLFPSQYFGEQVGYLIRAKVIIRKPRGLEGALASPRTPYPMATIARGFAPVSKIVVDRVDNLRYPSCLLWVSSVAVFRYWTAKRENWHVEIFR